MTWREEVLPILSHEKKHVLPLPKYTSVATAPVHGLCPLDLRSYPQSDRLNPPMTRPRKLRIIACRYRGSLALSNTCSFRIRKIQFKTTYADTSGIDEHHKMFNLLHRLSDLHMQMSKEPGQESMNAYGNDGRHFIISYSIHFNSLSFIFTHSINC